MLGGHEAPNFWGFGARPLGVDRAAPLGGAGGLWGAPALWGSVFLGDGPFCQTGALSPIWVFQGLRAGLGARSPCPPAKPKELPGEVPHSPGPGFLFVKGPGGPFRCCPWRPFLKGVFPKAPQRPFGGGQNSIPPKPWAPGGPGLAGGTHPRGPPPFPWRWQWLCSGGSEPRWFRGLWGARAPPPRRVVGGIFCGSLTTFSRGCGGDAAPSAGDWAAERGLIGLPLGWPGPGWVRGGPLGTSVLDVFFTSITRVCKTGDPALCATTAGPCSRGEP
ncbi:MAG: hypothetical protein CM15mP116_06490 [Synechococcus sp.]|nr:MAG: hypothetical protein CM15mP116_06490 [Synechococcus sp.]